MTPKNIRSESGRGRIHTISTLIPVESAGSFGDGRCCHPSGYLQIALGLPPSLSPKSLRKFHQTNRVNGITRLRRLADHEAKPTMRSLCSGSSTALLKISAKE